MKVACLLAKKPLRAPERTESIRQAKQSNQSLRRKRTVTEERNQTTSIEVAYTVPFLLRLIGLQLFWPGILKIDSLTRKVEQPIHLLNGYSLHNSSPSFQGSEYQTICSSRPLLLDQFLSVLSSLQPPYYTESGFFTPVRKVFW